MKQLLIALLLIGPSVALADPAPVDPPHASPPDPALLHSPYPVQGFRDFSKSMRIRHALESLRDEMIKMQAADGGVLSKADHDYLQAKYEAIQAGNY